MVVSDNAAVTVTLWVERLPRRRLSRQSGGLHRNRLPNALGDRRLLDGSQQPPRDATVRPD
jgi:hypothetical protein